MMFVGDHGKIIGGFRCENPQIITGPKPGESAAARSARASSQRGQGGDRAARRSAWVQAFRGGEPTYGDFLLAGPISEAFNLGAVSLRLGGRRLLWDADKMQVTNLPEANKFLTREYRKGWELSAQG
jgi:hypothetical protein